MCPAMSPCPHQFHDGAQLFSGASQLIAAPGAVFFMCDYAGLNQLLESFRQQRGRHQGNPLVQLAKAVAAGNQLPDHQQVHRSQSSWVAWANGQNCPYAFIRCLLLEKYLLWELCDQA